MKIFLSVCTLLVAVYGCRNPFQSQSQQSAATAEQKEVVDPKGFEGGLSDSLKEFRQSFITLPAKPNAYEESTKAVHTRLMKVRTNLLAGKYDGKDANGVSRKDMKALALQASLLIPLRGIVWRLRPVLEARSVLGDGRVGPDKSKNAFHSMVVTTLMTIATGNRILQGFGADDVGTDAWKALSRYFAYPYKEMAEEAKAGLPEHFNSIREFQDYLMGFKYVAKGTVNETPFYQLLSQAIDGIRELNFSEPILLDNLFVFGANAFPDSDGNGNGQVDTDVKDRYTALYEEERKLMLSALYMMRHNLAYFASYNWDQFPNYFVDVAKLVGFDGWGPGNGVNGMSAADRRQALAPYSNLFRRHQTAMRELRGTTVLGAALRDIRRAADLMKESWDKAQNRGNLMFGGVQIQALWQFGQIPQWGRIGSQAVNEIHAIVSGNGSIRSAVSGKTLTVKFDQFYGNNAPSDFKNFLPPSDGFVTGSRTITVAGRDDVRNYEWGMSHKWNTSYYSSYFAPVGTDTDVPRMVRELATSWGGAAFSGPFAVMSFVF